MVTALDSRRPDRRALGVVAGSGSFGGRCTRPVRRPLRRDRSRSSRSKGPATDSRPRLPTATRQPMHVVTVAYKPEEGTTRGDIRHIFRVHTDLPGEPPLDLTATLHVDP